MRLYSGAWPRCFASRCRGWWRSGIRAGSRLIYLSCLLTCSVILVTACGALLAGAKPAESLRLPVGLPWIGAHFTIDALSAFFLAVINLGAAAASLYALGYGEHEERPGRVLPFIPRSSPA